MTPANEVQYVLDLRAACALASDATRIGAEIEALDAKAATLKEIVDEDAENNDVTAIRDELAELKKRTLLEDSTVQAKIADLKAARAKHAKSCAETKANLRAVKRERKALAETKQEIQRRLVRGLAAAGK